MLSEVPEGWVIDYLGSVARIVTGKTPSTKKPEYWGGSLPFVTPTDLNGSTFVSHTERGLTSLGAKSAKLIPVGSLLFTCIASIGKAAINDKFPCVTNQQINSCVFDQGVETLFIHYQLQHRLNELQEISGKTAVSIISKSKFSQFALLLPPLPEQKRIAEILSSVDEFIQSQKQIIDQYQVTKKGLMDDLLTGKVRTV